MRLSSRPTPVLLFMTLVLLLAACGEGEDPRVGADSDGAAADADSGATEPGDGSAGEGGEAGEAVTLTVESWRSDDQALWEDEIIPAFESQHPDIKLEFAPTSPTEYNAALDSRLAGGTAGDIITCRPFDLSDELYENGHLSNLEGVEGLDNFPDIAISAWATEDEVYCMPMASVIHGFYYNTDIFNEVGVEPPATHAELLEILDTLQQHGDYQPLAWGTADDWIATAMSFTNVGPNYWKGEEGRQALIEGTAEFTDPQFVSAWQAVDDWQPYFPSGFQAVSYTDMQQMFMLGQAAIFPGGSWEISIFQNDAEFEIGAFPPPLPAEGDQCYISDHTDIAMGINAASPHQDQARTFLEWVAGEEFATIYSNALPGFFSLSEHEVQLENELAAEFVSWRDDCESTIRLADEELSSGDPNTENEIRRWTVQMWNQDLPPEDVAGNVQQALESWYEPQQD